MNDSIRQRWLTALYTHQPNLPAPVAAAMVDRAVTGQLGQVLQPIETTLLDLEAASLDSVTGSEARVLIAILRQMRGELTQLEARVAQLWD
jgi:hypothetical protein